MNFERTAAPDGIHDEIYFNEIKPRHGWLEHYHRKDNKDVLLASLLVALYLVLSTITYYWG